MKYAVWILRCDGLTTLMLGLCNIIAVIATALILKALHGFISGTLSTHSQLIYTFLLLLIVAAKPYLVGILSVRQLRRLNQSISSKLVAHRNADAAANVTKSFQICVESSVMLASLIAIPISGILLVVIAYPKNINIYILIAVVLVPLLVGFVLSKLKNANAVDLVAKQRARSKAYSEWSQGTDIDRDNFPSNLFLNELNTRRRESYLDESLNVLPNIFLVLVLLACMHAAIIELASFVSIYFIAKIIIDDIQGVFTSIAMLVRANEYFKVLNSPSADKVSDGLNSYV